MSNEIKYFDLIRKFPNDIKAYHMRSNPSQLMILSRAHAILVRPDVSHVT